MYANVYTMNNDPLKDVFIDEGWTLEKFINEGPNDLKTWANAGDDYKGVTFKFNKVEVSPKTVLNVKSDGPNSLHISKMLKGNKLMGRRTFTIVV